MIENDPVSCPSVMQVVLDLDNPLFESLPTDQVQGRTSQSDVVTVEGQRLERASQDEPSLWVTAEFTIGRNPQDTLEVLIRALLDDRQTSYLDVHATI